MNNEFQENNGSDPSKPRFIFEGHIDFIKTEPVINEELEISPDIDAVKTEQDEPNQSDKNDLNILIETKLNFPIENQTKVLKTFAPNTAEIAKHYTILTSEYSNNPIVPELIENNLANETHVEIKSETLESNAEVDVKEHITFEPFVELDIKENIVKTEENVVKQPLGIEDVRDNLKNGKSVLKDTVQNVVNLSTPIVIEDTSKISCMYCELRLKDTIQLAIHTHNFHFKSQFLIKSDKIRYLEQYFKACDHCEYQTERKADLVKHIFARHMPKQNKKTGRKCDKYTCRFYDKKFLTKGKMHEHDKTHNGNSSYKYRHRSLKVLLRASRIQPFACNLCKHIAYTNSALKYHMAKFHDLKSVVYNCEYCQSSFSKKDHLTAHLKLKSDDNKCPYKFIAKMQYEPYECGACPFKSSNKAHLRAHVSKHNITLKEERYSCQCCKFKSTTEKAFNQHLKTNHQLLKPYFCKLCDCKYSVMRDLVKHIKFTHLTRKK